MRFADAPESPRLMASDATLRDLFAIHALQGALAYPGASLRDHKTDEYVQYAYAMADRMLVERAK